MKATVKNNLLLALLLAVTLPSIFFLGRSLLSSINTGEVIQKAYKDRTSLQTWPKQDGDIATHWAFLEDSRVLKRSVLIGVKDPSADTLVVVCFQSWLDSGNKGWDAWQHSSRDGARKELVDKAVEILKKKYP